MGRPSKFDNEEQQHLVREYLDGASTTKLANCYSCSSKTIRTILRRHGIKLRPHSPSLQQRRAIGAATRKAWKTGKMIPPMLGKKHSKAAKQRMSLAQSGSANPGWNGGKKRVRAKNGVDYYVYVRTPGHPSLKGKSTKYVAEHRLVMEKYLGRFLRETEVVHHKNGVKHDNRIENLRVVTMADHHGKIRCPHCNHSFLIR